MAFKTKQKTHTTSVIKSAYSSLKHSKKSLIIHNSESSSVFVFFKIVLNYGIVLCLPILKVLIIARMKRQFKATLTLVCIE